MREFFFLRAVLLFIVVWLFICVVLFQNIFVHEQHRIETPQKAFQLLRNGRQPTTTLMFDYGVPRVQFPQNPINYTHLILTIPTYENEKVRIKLRPDLSTGSVNYIRRLVENKCAECSFYRSMKVLDGEEDDSDEDNENKHVPLEGLLLGNMANHLVPLNKEPGTCPDSVKNSSNKVECQTFIGKKCECHGPILQYGMVGWSGGTSGGPDFFVNLYKDPLNDLGTQYTIFGQVEGYGSFDLLEGFLHVDTSYGGSKVFNDAIHFHIGLE